MDGAKVKAETVVTPPPAHNQSRRPVTTCSLPVTVAVSQPLPSAPEVSQYLNALRPFPPYIASASYLGLPSHLGLPAFPGMPAHPVGHLNGKLSPSEHDKVGSVSVVSCFCSVFQEFRLTPYINDSTRTDFKFCVFFPLLFSPLPFPPTPPPAPPPHTPLFFSHPWCIPSVRSRIIVRVCACAPRVYVCLVCMCFMCVCVV